MPWVRPSWCKELLPDAPPAVVTLQSHRGHMRRIDVSDKSFYILTREQTEAEQADEAHGSWHAALLRDEHGKCFIMDLSSATGTFMKERQLEASKPHEWKPGTVVVLGKPPHHVKATLEVIARTSSKKRPADAAVCEVHAKRQKSEGTAKCDKCDGPHHTDACPHFKKKREEHKDAWVNYGNKNPLQMGRNGGKFILRGGRVARQPGDGSCLFHSLCFGLNGGRPSNRVSASHLRKELAHFIQRHPQIQISGDTLEEWVRWDTNRSVAAYARQMAAGSAWGGGIEMAVCSLLKKVNVHVYQQRRGSVFERISCFDCPERTKRTVHVLYQGGLHYDALVPSQ
mmetsp:Transcript_100152/g.188681  ORF Transcript_100152/g.188681 Transcript_100152/m.188681 type:complete len:341 (-) Transcript_100152:28-1050(-)